MMVVSVALASSVLTEMVDIAGVRVTTGVGKVMSAVLPDVDSDKEGFDRSELSAVDVSVSAAEEAGVRVSVDVESFSVPRLLNSSVSIITVVAVEKVSVLSIAREVDVSLSELPDSVEENVGSAVVEVSVTLSQPGNLAVVVGSFGV